MEKLNKTFFIDIDGTILKHRSNQEIDEMINELGEDSYIKEEPINDAVEFVNKIPDTDLVILTTARHERHRRHTMLALANNGVKYSKIIFDMAAGPRVLINDIKPIGASDNRLPLYTAFAMNVRRDEGDFGEYEKIEKILSNQIGSICPTNTTPVLRE